MAAFGFVSDKAERPDGGRKAAYYGEPLALPNAGPSLVSRLPHREQRKRPSSADICFDQPRFWQSNTMLSGLSTATLRQWQQSTRSA